MKDNKKNKCQELDWDKLDWDKKVQICQQGITHEDTLLITYVVIFIGLEALFFAAFFSGKLGCCANIVIAAVAIYIAIRFMKVAKKRGDDVYCWAAMLHSLWNEKGIKGKVVSGVPASKIAEQYKAGIESKNKKWYQIIFGWGTRCEKFKYTLWESPRKFITTVTPIPVIIVWITIIIVQISSTFDC